MILLVLILSGSLGQIYKVYSPSPKALALVGCASNFFFFLSDSGHKLHGLLSRPNFVINFKFWGLLRSLGRSIGDSLSFPPDIP